MHGEDRAIELKPDRPEFPGPWAASMDIRWAGIGRYWRLSDGRSRMSSNQSGLTRVHLESPKARPALEVMHPRLVILVLEHD
jgi:hypothetical protein